MVKLTVGPLHRVVALLASRGESLMRHRSDCGVVVVLMATHAGRAGDVVIVVDVAVGALPGWNDMRSGQRKSRLRVIKHCRLPGRRVVAGAAGLRETTCNMVRVRGVLEIGQVARDARCAGQVVVVVDVTVRALPWWNRMRAGQSEIDHRVIECGRRPGDHGVTLSAVRWEVGSNVIGVRRALKVLQVTVNASCAGEVENIVGVAVDALAWWYRVAAGQRESNRQVIEFRTHPVVRSMAGLARSRKLGGDMVRADSGLKIFKVAR
jgi:hypothetical protein